MAIRVYDTSESPLTVQLDTIGHGGYALKDVWVKDAGNVWFYVYGSHDGSDGTWRQIGSIHVNESEGHETYTNAYRFIKVSTDSETESEIEIVAGELG